MTLRERLADFISGGALTRTRDAYCEMHYDRDRLFFVLKDIAAMETPRCAHIGKRMAKVAKEALDT